MAYDGSVYIWFSKGKREIIDSFIEKYEASCRSSIRHLITPMELSTDECYQISRGGIITNVGTCDNAKIASVKKKVFLDEGQWKHGTLTCISQAKNNEGAIFFAITACHVIDHQGDRDITHHSENGLQSVFMCEEEEHLVQIGTSCYGILGGTTDGANTAVDIAFIPIKRPTYPDKVLEIFTGDITSLARQKVTCIGAKSGFCEGVIINTELSFVIGQDMRNFLLMIMPTGKSNRFTCKGDSGALVITENGDALGIISVGEMEMKDSKKNTVYASGAILLSPGVREIARVYGHIPQSLTFWDSANTSYYNALDLASNGFVTPSRPAAPL